MSKPPKKKAPPESVKIDMRIDVRILEELDERARAMGMNRSSLIKLLIAEFLQKREG